MASIRFVFLVLAFTSSFVSSSSSSSDSGRKELRNKKGNWESVVQLPHSINSKRVDPSRVTQISWRPRVFLYRGLLSNEECDHLISLGHGAEKKYKRTGEDPENVSKNKQNSSFRTELNIEDDIVARIEEKFLTWTLLPKENSKPLHVMRYGLDEAKDNLDYFGNKSTLGLSQPLMATVVLYLSNVTQGGELLFPNSEEKNKMWSDCAKTSNVLRPVKGNAILFFTVHPNAAPDESSSHTRCPVLEGEMWSAVKFFQVKAANAEEVLIGSDGNECTDEDDNCPHWAAVGECRRNPVYMVGSPDYYGTCRKSCHAC